jgi:hypothetical protein
VGLPRVQTDVSGREVGQLAASASDHTRMVRGPLRPLTNAGKRKCSLLSGIRGEANHLISAYQNNFQRWVPGLASLQPRCDRKDAEVRGRSITEQHKEHSEQAKREEGHCASGDHISSDPPPQPTIFYLPGIRESHSAMEIRTAQCSLSPQRELSFPQ